MRWKGGEHQATGRSSFTVLHHGGAGEQLRERLVALIGVAKQARKQSHGTRADAHPTTLHPCACRDTDAGTRRRPRWSFLLLSLSISTPNHSLQLIQKQSRAKQTKHTLQPFVSKSFHFPTILFCVCDTMIPLVWLVGLVSGFR